MSDHPTTEPARNELFPRWRTPGAFVLALALLAVGAWGSYWAEFRNDHYQLLLLGETVRSGGRMYVDCWENKTPGIAWINALGLWIGGGNQSPAWALPAVAVAAALVVFWFAANRFLSVQAARRGLILAAAVSSMRMYDAPSINPDSYAFAFEYMALSFWTVSLLAEKRRGIVGFGIVAGLLWAAATAVKQVGCVGLLAVGCVTVVYLLMRRGEWSRWVKATVAACTGFIAGAGVLVVVLACLGTLGEAYHAIFAFNTRYLPDGTGSILLYSWPRIRAELGPLLLPLWLGAMGAVHAIWSNGERLSRSWALALLGWIVVASFFAVTGPSMSLRYWQAIWAPMLWLAALGLDLLNRSYREAHGRNRLVTGILMGTALILLVRPLAAQYRVGIAESYLAYSDEPNMRERLTRMGREVAEVVPPDQAIYVWSFDVAPYLYADRLPASRFTFPRSFEQMDEILGRLEAGTAYAILIPDRPTNQFRRWCEEPCERRFANVLRSYRLHGRVEPYAVWVREPGQDAAVVGPGD